MRGPRLIVAPGLAAAAAVLLLAGCGSSGGTKSAAGGSPAAAATASSSAAAKAQGGSFCDQARAFAAQVASSVGRPDATTAQNLQQLAAQLGAINPPSEIAGDWHTAVSDIQQLGQALQKVNPSDPQGAAAIEAQVAPIEDQLNTSGQRIDAYPQQKCGIDVGGTSGGASPTS
jgi:hypothetical protein